MTESLTEHPRTENSTYSVIISGQRIEEKPKNYLSAKKLTNSIMMKP
jgi:hypothetical protein